MQCMKVTQQRPDFMIKATLTALVKWLMWPQTENTKNFWWSICGTQRNSYIEGFDSIHHVVEREKNNSAQLWTLFKLKDFN